MKSDVAVMKLDFVMMQFASTLSKWQSAFLELQMATRVLGSAWLTTDLLPS
jgi:hypothetical protein